jgi:hypothetical protein
MVEEALLRALQVRLRPDSEALHEQREFFSTTSGPMGEFTAKIRLAHLLYAIDDTVHAGTCHDPQQVRAPPAGEVV